jgi:hypothetical protein
MFTQALAYVWVYSILPADAIDCHQSVCVCSRLIRSATYIATLVCGLLIIHIGVALWTRSTRSASSSGNDHIKKDRSPRVSCSMIASLISQCANGT